MKKYFLGIIAFVLFSFGINSSFAMSELWTTLVWMTWSWITETTEIAQSTPGKIAIFFFAFTVFLILIGMLYWIMGRKK